MGVKWEFLSAYMHVMLSMNFYYTITCIQYVHNKQYNLKP